MPRIALDLNTAEDRQALEVQWRVAPSPAATIKGSPLSPASPARQAEMTKLRLEVSPKRPRELEVFEGFHLRRVLHYRGDPVKREWRRCGWFTGVVRNQHR